MRVSLVQYPALRWRHERTCLRRNRFSEKNPVDAFFKPCGSVKSCSVTSIEQPSHFHCTHKMPERTSRAKPDDYDPTVTVVLKLIRLHRQDLQLRDFQDILCRRDSNDLVFCQEWRAYIRSLNQNISSRGCSLDIKGVKEAALFLSDESLEYLGIKKETALFHPSTYSATSSTSTKSKMPPSKNSSRSSKKAPKSTAKKGRKSKSPKRTTEASALHQWEDFKQQITVASESGDYEDKYDLKYGVNKETAFKWVVTPLMNMEIPSEDSVRMNTGRGALFEAITTDVHASTLRTRFYLRTAWNEVEKKNQLGIHLLRPSSYEHFIHNIGEIEEFHAVMTNESESRLIARKQSIVKIKNDGQENFSTSEFYFCPTAPTSEIKGEVGDDEALVADIPLTVAKKIIPGDVDIEGRYVQVKDERYPVTTAVFSFQLACKESEVTLWSDKEASSDDDSDSDEEMRMQNKMTKKLEATRRETAEKEARRMAAAARRMMEAEEAARRRKRKSSHKRKKEVSSDSENSELKWDNVDSDSEMEDGENESDGYEEKQKNSLTIISKQPDVILTLVHKNVNIAQWVSKEEVMTAVDFWRGLPGSEGLEIIQCTSKQEWIEDNPNMAEYFVDDFSHFWAAKMLWQHGDGKAELHPRIEILARRLESESLQTHDEEQRRDRCANAAEERHASSHFRKPTSKQRMGGGAGAGIAEQQLHQSQKKLREATTTVQELQVELLRVKDQKREMESQLLESHIDVQKLQDMANSLLSEKLQVGQELIAYKQLKDGETQQLQEKLGEATTTVQEWQVELLRAKDQKREMESQLLESHIDVQKLQDMANSLLSEKLQVGQELIAYKQLKDGETQQLQEKLGEATTTVQEWQVELLRAKDQKREMESQLLESHIDVQKLQDMANSLLSEKLQVGQELIAYKQLKDGETQQLQERIRDALSEADKLTKAKSQAVDRCFAAEESLAEAQMLRSEMQHQLTSSEAKTQLLLATKQEELGHVETKLLGEQRRREEAERELVAKDDMINDMCTTQEIEIKQLKASNSLLLEEKNAMHKEIVTGKLELRKCSDEKEIDCIITEFKAVGDSLISANANDMMQVDMDGKGKSHNQLVPTPRSPEKLLTMRQRHDKSRIQHQANIEGARREKRRQMTEEKRSSSK
ncbi:hypothetical protein QTG54_012981 [Skeletonema marinoi]|uniref:Uncharacterized protein n=1 Tax=Skeletonema marinoi TaxID=267567 RepID=A0AAD8XZY8_9STRA|nr:hypothetical protein QTG54_012981 [Skeletonema marinoi]